MPSKSIIAALLLALGIAGLKFVGVSAHLPPFAVPADIVAENREHAVQMRAELATEQAVQQADSNDSPQLVRIAGR